jgi:glycosyltransferase involved in cell wall biosynthesis
MHSDACTGPTTKLRRLRVVIIQEHLPHYRVAFYDKLRVILSATNIDCILTYDPNTANNLIKGSCDWAIPIPLKWLGSIGWQPALKMTKGADLIVMQQESKYLLNYLLWFHRLLGGRKLALWGHGRNMQARNPHSWSEKVKRYISRRVDWWFAYNETSAAVVRELGFPKDRITLVNNSIDTKAISAARRTLSTEAIARAKAGLGIESENVAIYTGGLYEEKRIPFLLEAAIKIRAQLPDFHLIIIGGGPLAKQVQNAADSNSWIHYLGPMNDEQKVPYWAISKVSLMPGLVGLGVLDSFALGVPLITTAYPYHSPEIQYLTDGLNGIIVGDWESVDVYADTIVTLLTHDDLRESMAAEGRKAAGLYTIENMAINFANGIFKALQISGEPAHT